MAFSMVRVDQKIRQWLGKKPTAGLHPASEEFLKSLHLIVGLDQLLENFSAKLREMFDAGAVYVVLFEPITNRYVGKKAKGGHAECLAELNFSRSDHLIKWLNINQCHLEVNRQKEIIRFFSAREQELLKRSGSILVVPLIVINRLTGVLFISKKRNGELYSSEELAVLLRLADQSALAIEHALMYQFQEDKLKKLFHADKLATVGELAAGAAHEIRNPLTSIRSAAQYIKKTLPEDKQPFADGIIEEVDRIDQIIKGLLSFSRSSELFMEKVNLDDVLNQTLFLLDSEFRKHNIAVRKAFISPPCQITADAAQIKQVFLNILLNSVQAMPTGGEITLTTTDERHHEKYSDKGNFICVTLTDTGPGISEKDLPKVFDPFYTTKENGTGLGLSIAYGIVSKHGAEIEITSVTEKPKTGTTVTIRLPKTVEHEK
jgi:signal transduction histidine kinase